MMRQFALLLSLAFLLLVGGVRGDETDEVPRGDKGGGEGYSQQYHYNAHPSHGGQSYAGLSFDLSQGLFLALGAIILLLALASVCYPLLSKGGGGGGGDGWGSSYGSYRSLDLSGMSEKVLNAVEKAYKLYNSKNQ